VESAGADRFTQPLVTPIRIALPEKGNPFAHKRKRPS
jgi:hypothetical protein